MIPTTLNFCLEVMCVKLEILVVIVAAIAISTVTFFDVFQDIIFLRILGEL